MNTLTFSVSKSKLSRSRCDRYKTTAPLFYTSRLKGLARK